MSQNPAIIISQATRGHPAKQRLIEELAAGLARDSGAEVLLVPSLYDLRPDGSALQALRQHTGDLYVLSWLFPRATYWTLYWLGVKGQAGAGLLSATQKSPAAAGELDSPPVFDQQELPGRTIFCYDLRQHPAAEPLAAEIRRQLQLGAAPAHASQDLAPAQTPAELAARRWYPVIDFSRCTNCMECIDFCLFGVYGVDDADRILVELPDNCRQGCPACSRVCPEHAILFPRHAAAAIAGGEDSAAGWKLDLSELFGGAKPGPDPRGTAEQERAEHGGQAGLEPPAGVAAPDALERLVEQLDRMDL